MRITKIITIIALSILIGQAFIFAQKTTTVRGELVELTSYIADGIKPNGPAGKEIAIEKIKKGGMFALVEDKTNKILLLSPKSGDTTFVQTVSAFFGIKVAIKGQVYTKGGIRLIVPRDIGKSLK